MLHMGASELSSDCAYDINTVFPQNLTVTILFRSLIRCGDITQSKDWLACPYTASIKLISLMHMYLYICVHLYHVVRFRGRLLLGCVGCKGGGILSKLLLFIPLWYLFRTPVHPTNLTPSSCASGVRVLVRERRPYPLLLLVLLLGTESGVRKPGTLTSRLERKELLSLMVW